MANIDNIKFARDYIDVYKKILQEKGIVKSDAEMMDYLVSLRAVVTNEINKIDKPYNETASNTYNEVVGEKRGLEYSEEDIKRFADDVEKNLNYDYSKYSFDPVLLGRIKSEIKDRFWFREFGPDSDYAKSDAYKPYKPKGKDI